jgi:glyoxylase-like metal-dependent hydrolase (beta-lactamase superfamily II)
VLDYDPLTQTISTTSADALLHHVISHNYEISYLLETHAHADHLSASSYLQTQLHEIQGYQPPIGIGKRIGAVQELFGKRYAVPSEETTWVFDRLFEDDEEFTIGNLKATAIHLPGHTPDHLGYRIGGMFLVPFLSFPFLLFTNGACQITSSAATPSSIPTLGQRVVTFPVGTRITFSSPVRGY